MRGIGCDGEVLIYHLGRRVELRIPIKLRNNLDKTTKAQMDIILERFQWNLSRYEAKQVLAYLKKGIKSDGSERERMEGVPLIRRICKRLNEWVD